MVETTVPLPDLLVPVLSQLSKYLRIYIMKPNALL
jgi:hypothetical protein